MMVLVFCGGGSVDFFAVDGGPKENAEDEDDNDDNDDY